MRYCSVCAQSLPSDTRECPRCAAAVGQSCSSCGEYVPPGNRFCGQCGARLGAVQQDLSPLAHTAAPPRIGATLGTRREVTVLFLDLTNFTAAAHSLDSEEVFVWINETLRLLASVVHKYEGTIDKFTGDGLMALFGAPIAHENDPELAIRAALEMQTVIRPLRERILHKHGFEFHMRIGVNCGPVIAGNVGDGAHTEYTVLGDTVNLASRLEKSAEPGTVLVSAAIYKRTQPLFEFEILPPLSVKGVSEPLHTFRPLRLREQPGLVRGIAGLQAPMIGRDHLLARLSLTIDTVRAHKQHNIVLITGEAGLGKSRLVAEFRKTLSSSFHIYQGSCLAYARSTPLWVIAAIVRDILHLSEIDPPTIQRETLRAYLNQSSIADQDLLPYLNNVLGLDQDDSAIEARLRRMDASMLQRQTHTALRQLFLFEAERALTILVFDDLHWVDPASRDFLEYLIQTTADVPLLLVLVSRASERQTVVRSLIAVAEKIPDRMIDLQLQALSDTEGLLLIDRLIRQNTDDALAIKQQIARRAGGNPFYIEEIIRILIDRGGLKDENGVVQISPNAANILHDVPETLKGLILARFDQLPEAMRRTLQKAAVLGRSFPASLLQVLEGASPAAIAIQFAELEVRQFLVAEPFGWAQGYAFRHVLIQEAVYGTLLKRDRQQLHQNVAQLIERASFWPRDEQIEVLAYHYSESPTPGKAIPYLIDAAENAGRRYANETAIGHYRRAISLMPPGAGSEDDDFFRVRSGLGQALKFVGQFSEASRMLIDGLTPLQDQSIKRGSRLKLFVTLLCELADVRQRERAYDAAVTHLEIGLRALGEVGQHEDPPLWRSLMDRMAWTRFRQGRLDDALALAGAATQGVRLEYAEDPITLASLFNTIGGVHWQRAHFDAAISYVDRSLRLYKDLGYAWGMAISYINLGILNYTRGNWAQAVASFEEAYVIQRENGYLYEQALNLHNLGALHIEMGNHEQARRTFEISHTISQRIGHDFSILCAEIGLLKLDVIQSDFVAAQQHVEALQKLLVTAGNEEAIQVRWLTALVLVARGELAQGLHYAQQALQMARAASLSELESECLRVLGIIRMRANDYQVAEALFYKSIAVCRQRNDSYRQGLALLELGGLYEQLSMLGRAEQANQHALDTYSEAVKLFESLGASYDLSLAQTALGRLRSTSVLQKEDTIWNNQLVLMSDHRSESKPIALML